MHRPLDSTSGQEVTGGSIFFLKISADLFLTPKEALSFSAGKPDLKHLMVTPVRFGKLFLGNLWGVKSRLLLNRKKINLTIYVRSSSLFT